MKIQEDVFKCLVFFSPNPPNIELYMIYNREKQLISIFERLKTEFSDIFACKKILTQLLTIKIAFLLID